MKNKQNSHQKPTSEHIKGVKEAEVELRKKLTGLNNNSLASIWQWVLALLIGFLLLSLGVCIVVIIFQGKITLYFGLLLLSILLVKCCQIYGVIVGGFTFFTGLKLMFSGQEFSVEAALPFTIYNLSLSYFCLGWGLLMASRKTRSKIGFILGAANLLGGAFGLFQFKSISQIHAAGLLGSLISGILTISLGYSTIQVILESWSDKITKQAGKE